MNKDDSAKPIILTPLPEVKLDFTKAIDNIANVENHVMQFKGKVGMNPFMFINKHIEPLKRRYDKGERSKELYDSMMAMIKVEPKAPDMSKERKK